MSQVGARCFTAESENRSTVNGGRLVIAAATGYGLRDLEPFLRSLSAEAPDAQVILIVDDPCTVDRGGLSRLNRNVTLVPLPDARVRRVVWSRPARRVWKSVRRRPRLLRILHAALHSLPDSFTTALLHISLARYFFALEILRGEGKDVESVLLSDSRDVFFQANPFRAGGDRLMTGGESPPIGSCEHNSQWVRDLYGASGLEELRAKQIVCSGVTMGPRGAMSVYLVEMCEGIDRSLSVCAFRSGYDQGVHNRLVHSSRGAEIEVARNGGPAIATLHHSELDDFDWSDAHGLRTRSGQTIAIVHQYDRKQAIARWCELRFGRPHAAPESEGPDPLA